MINPIHLIFRFVMWALPIRRWAETADRRSGRKVLTQEFTFHQKPLTIPLALLPFAVIATAGLFVVAFGNNIDRDLQARAVWWFWSSVLTVIVLLGWQLDLWRRGMTSR